MAGNKTKAEATSVADFIAAVPDPVRRADAQTACAMMTRVTGAAPVMWGPTIVGFGSYHYVYDSGREGDMCRVGFSPRKAELVFYVLSESADPSALLSRLGKHRTGKGCLYIKRLADIDMTTLETLVAEHWARMAADDPA